MSSGLLPAWLVSNSLILPARPECHWTGPKIRDDDPARLRAALNVSAESREDEDVERSQAVLAGRMPLWYQLDSV
jgi:hypothetical protein